MHRLTWLLGLVLMLLPGRVFAQRADNPHGLSVTGTCSACHRADGWRPVAISRAFQHAPKTFPLDGAHAKTNCTSCHQSLDFSKVQSTCASCHQDVHKGEFRTQCARCHTARTFTDRAAMAQAHEMGRFPLRGAHATVACESCHTPARNGQLQFVNRPATCFGCHATTFRATRSPDHVAASFSQDCSTCHTLTSWSDATFDHAKTRFPLVGAHQATSCAECHGDKVYRGKTMACVGCHQADYQKSASPKHAAAGFSTECLTCHTMSGWKGVTFDHNTTRFPLAGRHQAATCQGCHVDDVYKGKATACASCHQAAYDASVAPPHGAARFPTLCESCHKGAVTWKGATFDHSATRFALTGAHQAASCLDCHGDKVYVGKSMACASCHQAKYDATTNPPHLKTGFSAVCSNCHGTVQWLGAVFDHSKTNFPLTGGHSARSCNDCHADGVYAGRSLECVSCHQKDYAGTSNPPHGAAGFSTTCQGCHSTVNWTGGAFDHTKTQFPLTGAHLTASCSGCHGDGVYKGKPTTCLSCHQADFAKTTNPPHSTLGFPGTCETCHTTGAWNGAVFDHAKTLFPLTGGHVAASCNDCHASGVYKGLPTACVSCHQTDYNNTTNPKHSTSGFGTTCTSCHTTTQWLGAVFNHSATAFPLTGAHQTATCLDCHASGVYKGLPTACASCHQNDYNATTNPHHAAAGFTTLCATCHTTTKWPGATFDHNTTSFPLTGAHIARTCLDCHADKVYNGKPVACVSCHQTDYNNTTNPKHSTSGFSTTCETCHTTTQWPGAVFNHSATAFPLTGAHLTATCLDCHASGVYKGLSTACASCHQTDYDATTNPHHAAAGFTTLCASCHTTTKWPGATYNHNLTSFPLTGAHTAATCLDCHADKVYNGKPTTCVSCHQTDYNNTTNPKHSTSGFPTTCQSCHTTIQWLGATFNHDGPYFPIYSGKHLGKWSTCADCHQNSSNYKQFECILCHQHSNKAKVDADHVGKAPGYTYSSIACYSCHPTGRAN